MPVLSVGKPAGSALFFRQLTREMGQRQETGRALSFIPDRRLRRSATNKRSQRAEIRSLKK